MDEGRRRRVAVHDRDALAQEDGAEEREERKVRWQRCLVDHCDDGHVVHLQAVCHWRERGRAGAGRCSR